MRILLLIIPFSLAFSNCSSNVSFVFFTGFENQYSESVLFFNVKKSPLSKNCNCLTFCGVV